MSYIDHTHGPARTRGPYLLGVVPKPCCILLMNQGTIATVPSFLAPVRIIRLVRQILCLGHRDTFRSHSP